MAKDRAKDSLDTLKEMKDREVSRLVNVLQTVKNAYEENERTILEQVRVAELGLEFGQSINRTKVHEMIQDSINWDLVVENILNAAPEDKISKIKTAINEGKSPEYKGLVNFVLEKLSPSRRMKVSYLQFWAAHTNGGSTTKKTPSSSPKKRVPSPKEPEPYNKEEEIDWLNIIGYAGPVVVFIICLVIFEHGLPAIIGSVLTNYIFFKHLRED